MGREMKFALITGGSMVLGATVFALITHARNHAPPPYQPPVATSRELDSLSEVTQAPPSPPPVADYQPTWLSTDEAESTTVREGGTATLSSDQPSNDSRPASPERVDSKPNRVDGSAAYAPPATDPVPPPPSDTPQQTVNSTPSNNTELREMLRRGK